MKSARTVMAIGAHPDDIELGAGATLLAMSASGWKLVLLVATRGENGGTTAAIREREQAAAAKLLQATLVWGESADGERFGDGEVEQGRATIKWIERNIKQYDPDVVLVPWRQDTHQDHVNLANAALAASRAVENVLFYEGPSSEEFEPKEYYDFDDPLMEEKKRLLNAHGSQMNQAPNGRVDFYRWMATQGTVHGLRRRHSHHHAYSEAFHPYRRSLFVALSEPQPESESQRESERVPRIACATRGAVRTRGGVRGRAASQRLCADRSQADAIAAHVDQVVAEWVGLSPAALRRRETAEQRARRIAAIARQLVGG